jgi:hypothetical protein
VLERIEVIVGSNGAMQTAAKLLHENSLITQRKINYSFVERVKDCLVTGSNGAAPEIMFLPLAILDERTRGHLMVFNQACDALLVKDFGALVRFRFKASGLTRRNAAALASVTLAQMKNWNMRRSIFPTDMTPVQALNLDRVLGANGEIIAAYAAMSQYSVFAVKMTVADKLLGKTTFGHLLRRCWRRANLTLQELLDQVESQTGIKITPSVISRWCCGLALPFANKEAAIEVIDKLCGFDKKLITAWKDAKPRPFYSKYRFARGDGNWPNQLYRELIDIFRWKSEGDEYEVEEEEDYFVGDDDEINEEALASKGKWRKATQELFVEFAEQFFGYLLRLKHDGTLVDEHAVPPVKEQARLASGMKFWTGSLSFSLMAEWKFIEGFYDFVRGRTDRTYYTMADLNHTKTLLCLYHAYMPFLAVKSAEEPYWVAKFSVPLAALAPLSGMTPNLDLAKRHLWQQQLDEAVGGAWNFLRTKQFKREPFRGKVQPLLDREVAMWVIAGEIEDRLKAMPLQVMCVKTAIELRRLAIAALLWARCFRPMTLMRLELMEVFLEGDRVGVDIPADKLKNDGKGDSAGGIKGHLANIEWFFTAIGRWKKEGRPYILKQVQALGGRDDGAFFTGARFGCHQNPGEEISAKTLYHDVVSIHGYPPYGQRYLFASAAWLDNATIEDIAATLKHNPDITRRFYQEATEVQKTARANTAMAALLACGG